MGNQNPNTLIIIVGIIAIAMISIAPMIFHH